MAFSHGRNAYFGISATAAASDPGQVNISTYLRSVSMSPSADTAETSTLGTTSKTYVAGLKDSTLSVEGIWDPGVSPAPDVIFNSLLGGEFAWFTYGPHGNTGGFIKYTGKGIVTSYEVSASVDDVVSFTAEIQVSGALTRGTF